LQIVRSVGAWFYIAVAVYNIIHNIHISAIILINSVNNVCLGWGLVGVGGVTNMKQSGPYPAIRIKRELYDTLKSMKYDLRVDSFTELIDLLLEDYKQKKTPDSRISLYG